MEAIVLHLMHADGAYMITGLGRSPAGVLFAKPSWQTGSGVPSNNARNVPDISLAGSAQHDGYLVYSEGSLQAIGGTSAPTPAFAGIATLLNHYSVANRIQASAGLGNINPRLYSLAQSTSGVFHDITSGDNIINVTCSGRVLNNCTPGPVGYSAGPGYDPVTGLGSVDAYNLIREWARPGATITPATPSITVSTSSSSIASTGSVVLAATVRTSDGSTPTGTVTFALGATVLGAATLQASGGLAIASLTVSGAQLRTGSNTITAQYSGVISSVFITVVASGAANPTISAVSNGASFKNAYAPGMILSVFGSQLSPATQSADNVPLPMQLAGVTAAVGGIPAPLYYVSPGQLNIQVPYEMHANSLAVVQVNNNGRVASFSFSVAAAAPGIFIDQNGAPVPSTSASRGQIVTLYVTGDGAVSPGLATGSAPLVGTALANLPRPVQPVTVTVGGLPAAIQFIGITPGLVGVTQINYQVPAGVGIGTQPVVVTVGNASSVPASLRVN